jgi:PAS domain S-box-containing protein
MQAMQQPTTRAPTRRYFVSMFVIVSALFVFFSMGIHNQYLQAQRLNSWVVYNYEVNRQSREILFDLVNMESSVRGYLLTGKRAFLEPYQNSLSRISGEIEDLWHLTKDDATTHANIEVWLKKIEEFSFILKHQVKNLNDKGIQTLSQRTLEVQKQEMDDLRIMLEGYIQTRLGSLQQQINSARDKQESFKSILIVGTVLSILGMLVATLGIIALIDRNYRAERKAKTSEERLLQVVSGIDDGLYDFHPQDNTVYFSPSYKAMLGYSDSEHPNTIEMFNKCLHPDDFEHTWENLRKYIEGETTAYVNVFRLQHKDGHWIWVLSRGVGLTDIQGKINRLIGTHTDITVQKNREEELKQLNNEMETFAYITSHDLRAPLVNLKGFAGEITHAMDSVKPIIKKIEPTLSQADRDLLHKAFNEDVPESVGFIVQAVKKMDMLTSALLDLSRIGKRNYRFEEVDTNALVKRCLDTLAYEINQKNIDITVDTLPAVMSDPLALEQIFSNILDNAVKYLDPKRKGKISISALQIGRDTIFSVQDNGRGIMEADKDKVFQIFRRARNASDVRGLGMGMTFIQAMLRQLGGAIWFDSSTEGTIFHFSLSKHVTLKAQKPAGDVGHKPLPVYAAVVA